ncbi:ABC transporter permease [Amycolatopsis jejuensis]|uniref:ABC transporter permease n=1 Tax=Amycolatopsis jejuensis TaxID=330084 RepID=UPI001FDF86D4|nr:ABC transporter permease [Amycolatopsis jejuensis]
MIGTAIRENAAGRRHPAGGDRRSGGLLHHPLVRVITRRVAMSLPLLLVVTTLTFLMASLTPGDAAREILGLEATPEEYANLREALGLDLPIYEQYWHWLTHALTGDLGTSLFSGVPVMDAIAERLPVTVSLVVGSLVVSLVIGVALGVASALRGGVLGRIVDIFALAGFALPAFWVGAMVIVIFAVQLHWLPATGYVSPAQSPVDWLKSLILPVVALSLGGVAAVTKQTREAMLDVLASEYIRMAWASGISARSIIYRHALKNVGVRVVTVIGLQAIGLLGGTVVMETVFVLPGIGSLAVSASIQHDLPVVQGVVALITVVVVVINLLVDLAYTWLNPKVRAR